MVANETAAVRLARTVTTVGDCDTVIELQTVAVRDVLTVRVTDGHCEEERVAEPCRDAVGDREEDKVTDGDSEDDCAYATRCSSNAKSSAHKRSRAAIVTQERS